MGWSMNKEIPLIKKRLIWQIKVGKLFGETLIDKIMKVKNQEKYLELKSQQSYLLTKFGTIKKKVMK
jgi:hypothetical protein